MKENFIDTYFLASAIVREFIIPGSELSANINALKQEKNVNVSYLSVGRL